MQLLGQVHRSAKKRQNSERLLVCPGREIGQIPIIPLHVALNVAHTLARLAGHVLAELLGGEGREGDEQIEGLMQLLVDGDPLGADP